MLNQEMWSEYSMTEPQGGSDPNLFKTHAVRDGEEWVINGEKWFTSAGRVADILFVMCTNGMFVVPRTTPGVAIMPEPRNHNHTIYNDVRVPLDHLLGPEDGAKVLRDVSFNALHILGSLGTTDLTPIQAMYAAAPTMGIADGVNEVHNATVARNVLKSYRPHEGYWPTEYIPAKREAAWEKFQPRFNPPPLSRSRPPAGESRRTLVV